MVSLLYMTVALNKTRFLPRPVGELTPLISIAPLLLFFSFPGIMYSFFVSHFKPLTYVFSLDAASQDRCKVFLAFQLTIALQIYSYSPASSNNWNFEPVLTS